MKMTRAGRTLTLVVALLLATPAAAARAADAVRTYRGQVVCSSCWTEADRKTTKYGTPADVKCAARCERGGIAAALAVEEKGSFHLYLLEDGAFKREGRGWLDYIARQVEITGTTRRAGKEVHLRVDALKVVEDPKKRS